MSRESQVFPRFPEEPGGFVYVDVDSGDVTTRKGSVLQAEGANDFGRPVLLSERSELVGISSPVSTKVDQWGLEGQGSHRSFTAKIAKHAKNIAKSIA